MMAMMTFLLFRRENRAYPSTAYLAWLGFQFPYLVIFMNEPLHTLIAEAEDNGARLDKWLSEKISELSRTRCKALIEEGALVKDGETITDPRHKVVADSAYTLTLPEPEEAAPKAEPIPLHILFEDEYLLVLNKPAGLVVHPAPGAWHGTLVNALLHHCGDSLTGIGGVARPGIVHRLDKETSGVMVVAKTEPTHHGLRDLFSNHDIDRAYLALTQGAPRPLSGQVETYLGRARNDRKKQEVLKGEDAPEKGKYALTNYKALKTFGKLDKSTGLPTAALIECRLETGRTHQIRVHMAHIGAPLLGDPVYNPLHGLKAYGETDKALKTIERARAAIRKMRRQALHAYKLGFVHPITSEDMAFETAPPEDFERLLEALKSL